VGVQFQIHSKPQKETSALNLNPKYTFSNFVVGSCNRLAHAAALGVAESPGQSHNPLYIYGEVGLGKTHLLHAVGHAAFANGFRIIYVSGEQFTNEFIKAIKEGTTEDFRTRFRNVDFLLIDDIHFINGKDRTQEGFFHTFNELHNANRQIVITSNRPPKAMPSVEYKLRSRFEGGLISSIQPPDLKTRLNILRTKAEQQQVAINEQVSEFIARQYQHNIRELEGSFARVVAYARLTREPLTVPLAQRALQDIAPDNTSPRAPTPSSILDAVTKHFNVSLELLKSKTRAKQIVLARQVAVYLIRKETSLPLEQIGRLLGGRDHSTIIHGYHKLSSLIESDPRLHQDVLEIKEALYPKSC
jgi:chromosomal replication initiator protein